MKTKKVLFIDARQKTIVETVVSGLDDMQRLVGGKIERAYEFDSGEELYVNEEGLFDTSINFGFIVFREHSDDILLTGNGFLIGPVTKTGNLTDCRISANDLSKLIKFIDIQEEDEV